MVLRLFGKALRSPVDNGLAAAGADGWPVLAGTGIARKDPRNSTTKSLLIKLSLTSHSRVGCAPDTSETYITAFPKCRTRRATQFSDQETQPAVSRSRRVAPSGCKWSEA